MSDYSTNTSPIQHNPRPTTAVLDKDNEHAMSTSPSLNPQSELEPPPSTSLSRTSASDSTATYPQFLLFGDSITQFSTLTFQAYLTTQYIRRLDVINRGLSGFTAPMGYKALQKFLTSTTQPSSWPPIQIATVFFGANDSCVPGESQHVDLQRYIDTLKQIIVYPVFNRPGTAKTVLVLITPPPVDERQLGNLQRRAGTTSQYAKAAAQAAHAYGVHCLDFWTILMRKVGWTETMGRDCCTEHLSCRFNRAQCSAIPPITTTQVDCGRNAKHEVKHIPGCVHFTGTMPEADYQLSDFLTDGLHLTKLGYDVLFWELMKLIRRDIGHCAPENLPFVLPEWRDALMW